MGSEELDVTSEWHSGLPSAQLLDAVLTRRRQLLEMLVAEKNRLGFATKPLHRGIQAHIRWLERQLDDVTKELAGRAPWRARLTRELIRSLHDRDGNPAVGCPAPFGLLRSVTPKKHHLATTRQMAA